jgi:hypothetical protein
VTENKKEKLPKLTVKQKRFLKYYLLDPSNAALAARKAGYSPKSSNEIACQLLNNSQLLPYLQLAAENNELEIGMSGEDIVNQLEGMANTNMLDIVEESESGIIVVKKLEDIPHEYGQYIQTLKEGPNGVEVKFYDKCKPMDMLARMKAMYNDKVSVTVKTIEDLVNEHEKESE